MRKVLFLSASFLLLTTACKKEGFLNPDFAENTTLVNLLDTISVKSRTIIGDTILADKISTGIAGLYRDSVFGLSQSDIHVQPLLPSNALRFGLIGDELITDSVVLSLVYNGSFGDLSKTQKFNVYRIDEQLDNSKNYYSNQQIQTQAAVLGTKTFIPNLDSSVRIISPNAFGGVDTLNLAPQLRIHLDKALGDEILSKSDQAEVFDNTNFTAFFKGLKISPEATGTLANNENAMLYFALTASNTKMTIYYTSRNATDTVKRTVDFPINSSSVRFNTFSHDYSGTPVETALQGTGFDPQYSYTMAMAGVNSVMQFPTLKKSLENKNIVINKAELRIPVANGTYANYGFAQSLIIASRNESGVLQFIPDFFEGTAYFGGRLDAASQSYTFNITRYIQGLLAGTENDNGLNLLVTGSAVKAERAVLFGHNNPSQKIRLNLYYSNTQ